MHRGGGTFKTKKTKMKRKEIKGYKGFDRNLKCRGRQYKVGETSTFYGKIKVGTSGLHFNESPTGVFSIYPPNEFGRYAEIKSKGKTVYNESYDAYCADKLEVVRELTIEDMYKRCCNDLQIANFENEYVSIGYSRDALTERSSNYSSCISAFKKSMSLTTGHDSAAITCGWNSYAKSTKDRSASIVLMQYSLAEANGNGSIAVAAKKETSAKVTGKGSIALSQHALSKVYVSAGSVGVLCGLDNAEFVGELGAVVVVLLMDRKREYYTEVKTFIVDGETILPNHIYTFEDGVPSDRGIFREDYKK